jgi:hypothetical protein
MSQLMAFDIELIGDRIGFGIAGTHLYRRILDNNDVFVTIGFNYHDVVSDGDGISVYLELSHGAPI